MTAEAYESILNKAKKIQELAERGIAGEAESARRRLQVIMDKYNISMEDLSQETIKTYDFKVTSELERKLLFHIAYSVTGNFNMPHGRYSYTSTGKKKKGIVWYELTSYQFVEISEMFNFHARQLRKEIKAFHDQLITAYINKHDLFPEGHTNDSEPTNDYIKKTLGIMQMLDDVHYRKSLKATETESIN